jgi:hypothetical protein
MEKETQFIEPSEYFQILKESVKTQEDTALQNQLKVISEQITLANKIDQQGYVQKLCFYYDCIYKEQALLANGFPVYLDKADITQYIDKCNGQVKIIELNRYLRPIPSENMQDIERSQKVSVFIDDVDVPVFTQYLVVYTDLVGESMETPEAVEYKKRNRDPIVFGVFMLENSGMVHDRMYLITDWEDDNCDLTFNKLISEISKNNGGNDPTKVITYDENYLRDLVQSNLKKMKQPKDRYYGIEEVKKEKYIPFYKRWFKNV